MSVSYFLKSSRRYRSTSYAFLDDAESKDIDDPPITDNKPSKVFKSALAKKEMELKLVAEIKERADLKNRNLRESPLESTVAVSSISHDPAAQLVSELSETLNLDCFEKKKDFTSHLKRLDPILKKPTKDEPGPITTPKIIDFKSRLRKVEKPDEEDNSQGSEQGRSTIEEPESNKRESTASSDSGNLKIEECEDKRKSTGSISSLKKLWEPKDATENIGQFSSGLFPANFWDCPRV